MDLLRYPINCADRLFGFAAGPFMAGAVQSFLSGPVADSTAHSKVTSEYRKRLLAIAKDMVGSPLKDINTGKTDKDKFFDADRFQDHIKTM